MKGGASSGVKLRASGLHPHAIDHLIPLGNKYRRWEICMSANR